MSENSPEIDALLAEVNALAGEAVGAPDGARPVADLPNSDSGDGSFSQAAGASGAARPTNVDRVLNLEVPVIVRLAERSMAMSDILNLTSGSIVEFEKPADSELDLLINNKCIAHGLAVKVAENFGLRLTRLGSVQDRIQAMRG